ncbi:c-type cytochrome [Terracidiphilus gabretensis]|uniref:c-type cytochrome n=1 Tax=Terracidiphilus gabretensis TaxID=1577687 RepID=UPI0009EC60CD|nr:cytochrome c [Terracidiphilus gabretensis]
MNSRILFILIPALILTGCRSHPQLTLQQAGGQNLYQERCVHCHEENDLALKPPPPSLSNLFRHSTLPSGAPATDAQVIRTVLGGKNKMPSFAGRFTEEQMDALLAYLHTGIQ